MSRQVCRVERRPEPEEAGANVVTCSRPRCDALVVFGRGRSAEDMARRLRHRGWVQGERGWECENH